MPFVDSTLMTALIARAAAEHRDAVAALDRLGPRGDVLAAARRAGLGRPLPSGNTVPPATAAPLRRDARLMA